MHAVTVPGRLETVSIEPLVIIDGAHNPDGIEAAAAALDAFGQRDWVVIFAAMADKDVAAMIPTLGTFASSIITTAVDHERAADPVHLAELAGQRCWRCRSRPPPPSVKPWNLPAANLERMGRSWPSDPCTWPGRFAPKSSKIPPFVVESSLHWEIARPVRIIWSNPRSFRM